MSEKNIAELLKQRDKELKEANDLIEELEFELEELENGHVFSESENRMLSIIEIEISRLLEDAKVGRLDKDEIKKFDSLVKDFVAIRGKMPEKKATAKSQEDSDNEIAEAISIVRG